MFRPEQAVSLLERFPPDIWAHFVCHLPGEQLGRLKMTGSTLVWQRLKAPRVVESVQLGQDFLVFKSFPSFLNELPSLEELVIHSCRSDWSPEFGLTIGKIPFGVKTLELSGFWGAASRTKLFGDPPGVLNLGEYLPHLETLNLFSLCLPDYSWMAHCPQSLTSLSIDEWDGVVELPSSLIQFEAGTVNLSVSSFVSKLPPSLESFVVRYSLRGVELLVPLLPRTLLGLDLGLDPEYSDGPRFAQNLLQLLPNSLTWFTVPHSREINFETNPRSISFLSTLIYLSIEPDFPCSSWPLLPAQLVELTLRVPEHISISGVKSFPFDLLPRSLTNLDLYVSNQDKGFCDPPPKSIVSWFPPQLARLHTHGFQLSPEAAKLLPSSLKYLRIDNLVEQVCEYLPSGLETLYSFGAVMSPNLINCLPKSLTKLNLYSNSSHPGFDYSGEVLNPVPKHPQDGDCVSNRIDLKQSYPLPPTLTCLSVHFNELGDWLMLQQRLPNLGALFINSQHLSDRLIPHLSANLTFLQLSSTKISGKSFPFLPRCLIALLLPSSELIFDCDIQYLPRTLVLARLDSAIHLTDLCIPELPPRLESLNLSCNSQITPSSFPRLPSLLRSSQLQTPVSFANWEINGGVVRLKQNAVTSSTVPRN